MKAVAKPAPTPRTFVFLQDLHMRRRLVALGCAAGGRADVGGGQSRKASALFCADAATAARKSAEERVGGAHLRTR